MGFLHLLVVIGRVTKGIDSWEINWILEGWVWGMTTINITIPIKAITIMLLTNPHI